MISNICFVAHEFGLFKGHGGIASYLYNITKFLIENTNYKVTILAMQNDIKCDLLTNKNLSLHTIKNELDVYYFLKINHFDYVEVADYLGLALYCLIKKHTSEEFSDTVFSVHHHTASRECFEWNSSIPIDFASPFIKVSYEREKAQILLADMQISPSHFMAQYVKKQYDILDDIIICNHLYTKKLESKNELRNKLDQLIDFKNYENSFNIVLFTRIEGRKNQAYLIDQFLKFNSTIGGLSNLFLIGNSNKDEITGEDVRYKLFKSLSEEDRKFVHFYDFIPLKDQGKFISIADLSIIGSTFENFPIAMLEMVIRGIPIIASKYTGCMDYIGDKNTMSFNPFEKDSLAKKILNFYNLTNEAKNKISRLQYAAYKRITDPSIVIFNRLKQADKILSSKIQCKTKNSQIKNIITKLANGRVVFIPNNEDLDAVSNFLLNFKFNINLEDKIIILNDRYDYISSAQDVVDLGLPILFPCSSEDRSEFQLLNYLIDNGDKIVEINIGKKISRKAVKKFTDFVFAKRNKIDFSTKI